MSPAITATVCPPDVDELLTLNALRELDVDELDVDCADDLELLSVLRDNDTPAIAWL